MLSVLGGLVSDVPCGDLAGGCGMEAPLAVDVFISAGATLNLTGRAWMVETMGGSGAFVVMRALTMSAVKVAVNALSGWTLYAGQLRERVRVCHR